MLDLVKSVLGGGWSLLIGWIVPAACNVALFVIFTLPSLRDISPFDNLKQISPAISLIALIASVLFGLFFAAIHRPLYKLLEGYSLPAESWSNWLIQRRTKEKHELELQLLKDRLSELKGYERDRLAKISAALLMAVPTSEERLTQLKWGLTTERLARYPIDDGQIAPTKLGNAIRRLETYAQDRFSLDSQSLWYELESVVPDSTRKAEQNTKANVDFFVCLFYGSALLAALDTGALIAHSPHAGWLGIGALVAVISLWFWYRGAVLATDEWSAAVQAIINIGRQPLADSLGLKLPDNHAGERKMWDAVSRLSREAYDPDKGKALDPFRRQPD